MPPRTQLPDVEKLGRFDLAVLINYWARWHRLLFLFGAPPQAWVVGDRETNVRHELPQLADT